MGYYLILWIGVLFIFVIRLSITAIGFDPEIVEAVHWMEVAANIVLFASFFWRIALRAYRGIS